MLHEQGQAHYAARSVGLLNLERVTNCAKLAIVLSALGSLVSLAGCGLVIKPPPDISPKAPNIVSLDPQDWYVFYSFDVPEHPSPQNQAAWSLAFPSIANNGHVNYVQTPFNTTMTPSSLTMTFQVQSSAPKYVVIDPSDHPPATICPFFEQKGDDLQNPYGRWWAGGYRYTLGSNDNQTITITVPLTYDQWSAVYGEHDPVQFSAALQNIGWVGFTCGGQDFFGHGVALADGTANFVLIDYQVN